MMRKITVFTMTAVLIAGMTGCAAKKVAPPEIDPAIHQLNQAAESIQDELEVLARIKQANNKQVSPLAPPKTGPLAKKITLKWSGPLEDVLEVISDMINYEFRVRGKIPAAPVLVHVDRVQVAAFEVLEDLGWKAGEHQVSVDAEEQVVQLTYFEPAHTVSAGL